MQPLIDPTELQPNHTESRSLKRAAGALFAAGALLASCSAVPGFGEDNDSSVPSGITVEQTGLPLDRSLEEQQAFDANALEQATEARDEFIEAYECKTIKEVILYSPLQSTSSMDEMQVRALIIIPTDNNDKNAGIKANSIFQSARDCHDSDFKTLSRDYIIDPDLVPELAVDLGLHDPRGTRTIKQSVGLGFTIMENERPGELIGGAISDTLGFLIVNEMTSDGYEALIPAFEFENGSLVYDRMEFLGEAMNKAGMTNKDAIKHMQGLEDGYSFEHFIAELFSKDVKDLTDRDMSKMFYTMYPYLLSNAF